MTNETKRLRVLLEEYNICQLIVNSSSTQITLDEALHPIVLSSKLGVHADTTVSKPHQDIIEAYLQMKRSNEEILLLEKEMANTIQFYAEQQKSLLIRWNRDEFLSPILSVEVLLHCYMHCFRGGTSFSKNVECRMFPISTTINIPQQLDFEGYETDSGKLTLEDYYESDEDDEVDY